MTDNAGLVERLSAPAYWISGSADGHEGESDAPYLAAQALTAAEAEIAQVTRERDEALSLVASGAYEAAFEKSLDELNSFQVAIEHVTEKTGVEINRRAFHSNGYAIIGGPYLDDLREQAEELVESKSALTKTRAMLAEAVEALEPFRGVPAFTDKWNDAAIIYVMNGDTILLPLRLVNFRRARSTLTKIKEAGHVAD